MSAVFFGRDFFWGGFFGDPRGFGGGWKIKLGDRTKLWKKDRKRREHLRDILLQAFEALEPASAPAIAPPSAEQPAPRPIGEAAQSKIAAVLRPMQERIAQRVIDIAQPYVSQNTRTIDLSALLKHQRDVEAILALARQQAIDREIEDDDEDILLFLH